MVYWPLESGATAALREACGFTLKAARTAHVLDHTSTSLRMLHLIRWLPSHCETQMLARHSHIHDWLHVSLLLYIEASLSVATCTNLQVSLKALRRHSVGKDDIFESVAELPLHKAAMLLQLRVQQMLNLWRSRLLHLQPYVSPLSSPPVYWRAN